MKQMPRNSPKRKHRKKNDRPFIPGHILHARYMEAVPGRARLVVQHLRTVNEIFGPLLSDENFVTLLRAESMTMVPIYLQPLLKREDL
jgi:hypothetical protein